MEIRQIISRFVKSIQKHPLSTILILGLIHGLIYVFMIPPWWHHEEPGHFEYAWLAANREEWPQPGDYDNDLRREIAVSMLESGQENLYNVSRKRLKDDPIVLGFPMVGRKPVYYWTVSWSLRLVRNQPVLTQLYVARTVSLAMFVVSLWLAWLLMRELVKENHPLQWLVPLFLALLPGYVDNMTSVHDDVIGAVVAALFYWLSVRIIIKGFSPLLTLAWIGSSALCFYARDSTMILLLLAPIVPLSLFLKKKTVPVLGGIIFFVGIVVASQVLTFRDASQWYYYPATKSTNRVKTAQAPFGDYTFSLSGERPFGQSFAPGFIKPLRKKTLTLGVWIWAETPTQVSLPIIQYRTRDGLRKSESQKTQIGTTPAFFTTTFYLPYEIGHTWLIPMPAFPEGVEHVYYDGFVLVEGEYGSTPPIFDNQMLGKGEWDGQSFQNLVRNPSAERAWLGLRETVNRLQIKNYIKPALFLQTIQDWHGFGWYNRLAISSLFQGFWGRSAAAQVPLLGEYSYGFLQIISFLAILGSFHYILNSRLVLLRPEIFFLAVALPIIWIPAFFRGTWFILNFVPLVPYTRYAFPAFAPTALFICAGLIIILRQISKRYSLPEFLPEISFSAFMLGLAFYAIFSFGGYFYPIILNLGHVILFIILIYMFYIFLYHYSQAIHDLSG